MYSSPDGEAFSKKEFSLLLAEVTVKKKKKVLQQNGKTWFQLLTIRNCPSPERGPVDLCPLSAWIRRSLFTYLLSLPVHAGPGSYPSPLSGSALHPLLPGRAHFSSQECASYHCPVHQSRPKPAADSRILCNQREADRGRWGSCF